MKIKDVIKAAADNNPKNCSSSTLRWYGKNKSLLFLKDNKWQVALLKFDDVIFIEKNQVNNQLHRCGDRFEYCKLITLLASKGHLMIDLYDTKKPEVQIRKTLPNNYYLLRSLINHVIPKDQLDLYWKWVWLMPLCSYASELNKDMINIDLALADMTFNDEFNKFKDFMQSFNSVAVNGNTEEKRDTLENFFMKLNVMDRTYTRYKQLQPLPYTEADYITRQSIQAIIPTTNESNLQGFWNADLVDRRHNTSYHTALFHFDKPHNLFERWDKLVNIFKMIDLPEPTVYDIKFCKENIKTLAALFDTAKQDYTHPLDWLKHEKEQSEPAQEAVESYPTTLLA
jgi:hypothetical protein